MKHFQEREIGTAAVGIAAKESARLAKLAGLIGLAMLLVCALKACTQEAPPMTAPPIPKFVNVPTAPQLIARIKPTHPRLLMQESWKDFTSRVANDRQLGEWSAEVRAEADKILLEPVSTYQIPDGKRLLATSRRVLVRSQTLSLAYRLEGKPEYLNRLWLELSAAAQFRDWNPSHFLDTAEMTHAFAIAYDWLFDVWTLDQRNTLRKAIVEKGLRPGMAVYRRTTNSPFWQRRNNWNIVCNAGLSAGALAIGDEEPAISGSVLTRAIETVPTAMREYAPDGAWSEGPGYWNYATAYNVLLVASLQSALGTDYGLSDIPGFDKTGLFPNYMTSPIGRSFNFADSSSGAVSGFQLFWFAQRYNQPLAARQALLFPRYHPYRMVFYQPTNTKNPPPSLDKFFHGPEVVTMRSSWEDPKALFVGFKGGDNKAPHAHLDLGTFVLDALGSRWISNAGADDYNLPGYFGSQRWNYYRLRAESKNTLLLNPDAQPDQDPQAVAKVTTFHSEKNKAFAIIDLEDAYRRVANVQRGVMLADRTTHPHLVLQDEIAAENPMNVWWAAYTSAEVSLNETGTVATLSINEQKMQARLLSPPGARFEVLPAAPLPTSPNPPNQQENKGVRKLAIHLPATNSTRITVDFVPIMPGKSTISKVVTPLEQWSR